MSVHWGKADLIAKRRHFRVWTHLGRLGDRLFGAPISLAASLGPEREAGDRSDTRGAIPRVR